jgi:hypothetical protein
LFWRGFYGNAPRFAEKCPGYDGFGGGYGKGVPRISFKLEEKSPLNIRQICPMGL